MLFLKPDVQHDGVSREVWFAVGYAAAVRYQLYKRAAFVTSMREGQHSKQTLHDDGQAADMRSADLTPDETFEWCNAMAPFLNACGFDVVQEETDPQVIRRLIAQYPHRQHTIMQSKARHVHVEFQPKAGEQFIRLLPRASEAAAGS